MTGFDDILTYIKDREIIEKKVISDLLIITPISILQFSIESGVLEQPGIILAEFNTITDYRVTLATILLPKLNNQQQIRHAYEKMISNLPDFIKDSIEFSTYVAYKAYFDNPSLKVILSLIKEIIIDDLISNNEEVVISKVDQIRQLISTSPPCLYLTTLYLEILVYDKTRFKLGYDPAEFEDYFHKIMTDFLNHITSTDLDFISQMSEIIQKIAVAENLPDLKMHRFAEFVRDIIVLYYLTGKIKLSSFQKFLPYLYHSISFLVNDNLLRVDLIVNFIETMVLYNLMMDSSLSLMNPDIDYALRSIGYYYIDQFQRKLEQAEVSPNSLNFEYITSFFSNLPLALDSGENQNINLMIDWDRIIDIMQYFTQIHQNLHSSSSIKQHQLLVLKSYVYSKRKLITREIEGLRVSPNSSRWKHHAAFHLFLDQFIPSQIPLNEDDVLLLNFLVTYHLFMETLLHTTINPNILIQNQQYSQLLANYIEKVYQVDRPDYIATRDYIFKEDIYLHHQEILRYWEIIYEVPHKEQQLELLREFLEEISGVSRMNYLTLLFVVNIIWHLIEDFDSTEYDQRVMALLDTMTDQLPEFTPPSVHLLLKILKSYLNDQSINPHDRQQISSYFDLDNPPDIFDEDDLKQLLMLIDEEISNSSGIDQGNLLLKMEQISEKPQPDDNNSTPTLPPEFFDLFKNSPEEFSDYMKIYSTYLLVLAKLAKGMDSTSLFYDLLNLFPYESHIENVLFHLSDLREEYSDVMDWYALQFLKIRVLGKNDPKEAVQQLIDLKSSYLKDDPILQDYREILDLESNFYEQLGRHTEKDLVELERLLLEIFIEFYAELGLSIFFDVLSIWQLQDYAIVKQHCNIVDFFTILIERDILQTSSDDLYSKISDPYLQVLIPNEEVWNHLSRLKSLVSIWTSVPTELEPILLAMALRDDGLVSKYDLMIQQLQIQNQLDEDLIIGLLHPNVPEMYRIDTVYYLLHHLDKHHPIIPLTLKYLHNMISESIITEIEDTVIRDFLDYAYRYDDNPLQEVLEPLFSEIELKELRSHQKVEINDSNRAMLPRIEGFLIMIQDNLPLDSQLQELYDI